jgi:lipopolysaccharide export system permease protein
MSQRLSPLLLGYVARQYLHYFLLIFAVLGSVSILLDSVELLRRLAKYDNLTAWRLISFTLLKSPEILLEIMPFTILISGVFTFWQLTRTSELVVIRATGVSVWQFMLSPLLIACTLGVIKMTLLNPIGAVLLSQFEKNESLYMNVSDNTVKISKTGLWLRQRIGDNKIAIIHAHTVQMPDWVFSPVTAFFFNNENELTYRIDSKRAELQNNSWLFSKAWSTPMNEPNSTKGTYFETLQMPTKISLKDIQSRFVSPNTVSFWNIPNYAHILQETGFSSANLWSHFYSLLAEPFLNMALILLAAALSLRAPRQQRGWWLVYTTIATGFIVFFMGDFLQALGISDRLPIQLASFAPATILLLMGLTALLYLEDG